MVRNLPAWKEPKDERELGKRRWKALTSLGAAFLALFGALINAWEHFTWNYSAPAAKPEAGIDALRGNELETLRGLDPGLDLAALEPRLAIDRASVTDSPDALLRLPALLLVVTLALLASAAWYWARPDRKHAPSLVASALFLFLGPLLGVYFLTFAVQGFRTSMTSVYASTKILAEELEPLAGRLYAAVLQEDWRVTAQHDARIVDRLTGTTLAEVRTLVSSQPSPFDRWRMSWRGPIRQEPQVVFTLLSRREADGSQVTLVRANGGLAEPEAGEDWSREIATLLRRL